MSRRVLEGFKGPGPATRSEHNWENRSRSAPRWERSPGEPPTRRTPFMEDARYRTISDPLHPLAYSHLPGQAIVPPRASPIPAGSGVPYVLFHLLYRAKKEKRHRYAHRGIAAWPGICELPTERRVRNGRLNLQRQVPCVGCPIDRVQMFLDPVKLRHGRRPFSGDSRPPHLVISFLPFSRSSVT